ncbi:hypothetical protein [Pseudodesulfovibrio pelocollis]|uniref:hypothetical protein n=1 Tax=Pseudodesulfovibrio pelocollis TaxID=3051432 RepID=UPI00255A8EFB|nr:hypothetical protein [Pseudodesulfovibrio sp. SB368]
MGIYRKLSVEIEAIQFNFAPQTAEDILSMAGPNWEKALSFDERGVHIETLEGTMTGGEGDYIIKGIKGELYPCKPDVFEATYEAVDMSETAFKKAARPLLKYMAENHHPHTLAIVTSASAEVLEGQCRFNTDEYLVD